jgi:hypothetical protein
MPVRLTWEGLIIQNIAEQDFRAWIANWAGWVDGRVAPVFMSTFWDWFLRRSDGSTVELSVLEGTVETVARTPEEFARLVNTREWQEVHLLFQQFYELHERGTIPGSGQCYGFAPHPVLAGKIDTQTVMILDIPVWQSICAGIFVPNRSFQRSASSGNTGAP